MDLAYIEILDTNTELRKDLAKEIANNKASEKKICALIKEVEKCYRTISQQDSTIDKPVCCVQILLVRKV